MNSVITFVEFENQHISAKYCNLMIGATVVLVDNTSGDRLSDPVIRIASPAPNGSLRIKVPASLKPGTYFLRALNAHGVDVAQSAAFHID
jgi:hypothetical protein